MSLETMLRVWKHSQTRGAARCLMLALADYANDDGISWPGTANLAERINEASDYTDVLIKKCIEAGELVKHSGRGRGHKTRFAILCGLPPDAQKCLKGVLQKGYSSTPLEKRGATKGVLQSEKRGTFSGANYHTNGASERGDRPITENVIHDHDPHDGDGDRARARKLLREAGLYNGTIKQIFALDIDSPTLIASVQNLAADGWGPGAIANELRENPPMKGHPYERQHERQRSLQPDDAPDPRRRSGNTVAPRGRHAPTGGAELRDPGWMDRELAKLEAAARENGEL